MAKGVRQQNTRLCLQSFRCEKTSKIELQGEVFLFFLFFLNTQKDLAEMSGDEA